MQGGLLVGKGKVMKNVSKNQHGNGMLPEYDFRKGVRGKYARKYAEGNNAVLLDSDVSKVFPTSESINRTLRVIAGIIHAQSRI